MLRAVCLACALLLPVPALALDLTVEMEGIDPAKGPVMLGLFDRADLFDRAPDTQGQALVALRVVAGGGRVSVALTGLPPGRYAAAAYQDTDRDGKLATNLLGMPTEPYGFSAPAAVGRPSFEAASADSAKGVLRLRFGG